MTLGKMGVDFDFASLKLLLKGTTAAVLCPGDGEKYEKSLERWSEHCIKRAVSHIPQNDHLNSSFQLSCLIPLELGFVPYSYIHCCFR